MPQAFLVLLHVSVPYVPETGLPYRQFRFGIHNAAAQRPYCGFLMPRGTVMAYRGNGVFSNHHFPNQPRRQNNNNKPTAAKNIKAKTDT